MQRTTQVDTPECPTTYSSSPSLAFQDPSCQGQSFLSREHGVVHQLGLPPEHGNFKFLVPCYWPQIYDVLNDSLSNRMAQASLDWT